MYDIFKDFQQLEIIGISDSERDAALSVSSNFSDISQNNNLMNILKTPLFLNMYLESQETDKTINTRGEILNSYIMEKDFQKDSNMQFIVRYALPFAARNMFIRIRFIHDISRADLLDAIDEAIEFYLINERIYQNYIAPQKINKKHIIRFRRNSDMVEMILERLCFMQTLISDTHRLCFCHQYYRDYFAAKHILNLIDAIDVSYENDPEKRAECMNQDRQQKMLF